MKHRLPKTKKTYALECVLVLACLIFLLGVYFLALFLPNPSGRRWGQTSTRQVSGPCAIALYGLPRSFQSLVLPSLIQNVIRPNAVPRCDYFVYFHNANHDPGGRDYRSRFGERMVGTGEFAILLHNRWRIASRKLGLENDLRFELNTQNFSPKNEQLSLL